jgi:hypothetical protein
MPFLASIAQNILRVYSINQAAYKAVLSTTEAIPRERRREVIVIVIESKSNILLLIEIF